ncbi:MAG: bifunctional aspartate kinase/homoserine dehydrogenase I [Acidobacteria bacterium]|nr:bifunctional aspartate kinase/homoserine dehydrogenase I [Acidobacteriota bacterium]
MKVQKFGGSSVANAENIEKVINIVSGDDAKGKRVLVFSALKGTTDALIKAGRLAEIADDGYLEIVSEIEQNHRNAIRELFPDIVPSELDDFIDAAIAELESVYEGVRRVQELSGRTLDKLLSFGELAMSRIISEKLNSLGIKNEWLDSREVLLTDSNFGFAAVDRERTYPAIAERILNAKADLFVAPGFIGRSSKGATTTLGRGGSDYTAALFAAATDADVLEIWTDVSGMMTADPRFVRKVRHIPQINYREAMELSHFGAKVIYPPTIQPVMSKGIPMWIKNTFDPESHGTLIETEAGSDGEMIRGITSIDNIAVLSLEGSGMVGIPGFSRRLFDALSRARINVILITQSSSEHSICVAVDERDAETARSVVDLEFENEIKVGKIEPLDVQTGSSILALVGDNMRAHTGVSGRMFMTLAYNGINIRAIAQGSSERNISAIISSRDVRKAVNALHEEFFSDGKKQVNLYIAGAGTVGRKLLEQIASQADILSEKMNLNLRVIGLANSRRCLLSETGLELDTVTERLAEGEETDIHKFTDTIGERNLRNSVFIDLSASPDVVETYSKLLENSVAVIACNKIACSSELARYKKLKWLAREYNANFHFETNVGAGLPIISTLSDLIQSGDSVHRIEAVLSGTLNYVFNNYDGSRPFADIVRQAQDEGYTEPDPRLDLSGTDVARKILILAREAGYDMEIEEVENTPFLPESCLQGSVEDFYTEMLRNEDHFRRLYEEARSEGLSLKYIAVLSDGKAKVGLQKIGPEHNFANLSGKDNAVLFYTSRYSDQPLVIKGAGAGADVTAAGVFADIIKAARS